jgi:hypothetical protein
MTLHPSTNLPRRKVDENSVIHPTGTPQFSCRSQPFGFSKNKIRY